MSQELAKNFIREAIMQEDVYSLVKSLWGYELTNKQVVIVRKIAFSHKSRVCINCMTRYGKSFAVGLGIALFILLHRNKKIALIGPKKEQAAILRDYLSEFVTANPLLSEMAMLSASGIERLKKEASKNRLTFSNGCEYRIFSAYHEANALMGFGADLAVIDESCLINAAAFPKILRMLGDNPEEASLIMLANPWNENNYYGEAWYNGEFDKVHVGWEEALKEGRVTKEFIEEMRTSLSPVEFQVLYESRFPDQTTNALIASKDIETALNKEMKWKPTSIYFGVDIARYGNDKTVICIVGYNEELDEYKLINAYSYFKQSLTSTAGTIMELCNKYNPEKIYVDDTGMGGGVTDMLKESELTKKKTVPVIAGSTAELTDKEKKRFDNVSSRNASRLADYFSNQKISIKPVLTLVQELKQPVFVITSKGKTKVEKDPENKKSPDFFDSLSLACSRIHKNKMTRIDFL